ncbi:MAG: hypothetical protein KW788_02040 [Candidatus Doudnabacteria bacterium]|nr:hypothetical protein [Candidatus Doudnabacteria bacterium]
MRKILLLVLIFVSACTAASGPDFRIRWETQAYDGPFKAVVTQVQETLGSIVAVNVLVDQSERRKFQQLAAIGSNLKIADHVTCRVGTLTNGMANDVVTVCVAATPKQ